MPRSTGTVKWFSREKGYGFIRQADGPDVFVHYSAIQAKGFRTLEEGERVEFEIIEEPKGLRAQNVVRLEESPEASAEADVEVDVLSTSVDEAPVDEAPVDETAVDEAPVDETPVDVDLDDSTDMDADLLDSPGSLEPDAQADR